MSTALGMLHPRLRKALGELGYERLLPIQEKSIPVILSRSHTLIVAPTGSGKTEAAVFPVASMMLEEAGNREPGGVRAVYITPLRALNRDVTLRIQRILEAVGLEVQLRHGDTTATGRRRFLSRPPHMVITTPESLNLLLTVKDRRKLWSNVRWVIVDEVHEVLDNKRGAELSVVLERLQRLSRYRIQRIGLSATLSKRSLAEAARLIAYGRRVVFVEDESSKKYSIGLALVPEDNLWRSAVSKIIELATETKGSVLVFTNTRGTAEKLANSLARYVEERGLEISVAVHHGSLSRRVREEAEKSFREGRLKILVATSSMELGIDIGSVDLVIQFLSPRQVVAMTQRAGRAGHRIGETSRAVIVTSTNLFEVLESGVIALRTEKGDLEDLGHFRKPFDVLAHQAAGIVIEEGSTSIEELHGLLTRTGPFEALDAGEAEKVLEHLDSVRVVKYDPETGVLRRGGRTYSYFYRVSMIPDESTFQVYDVATGARVGEISERFVESSLLRLGDGERRFRFVLGGKAWEAVSLDYEKGRIDAVFLGPVEGLVPAWEGEIIPVSRKVAREVCSILGLCQYDLEACRRVLTARKAPVDAINRVLEIARATAETHGGGYIHPYNAVIEEAGDSLVLYSCLGSNGNLALALLTSKILETSVNVEFDYMPYAIIYRSPTGISAGQLARAIDDARRMDPAERLALIQDSLRRSRTYMIRFIRVAKRMGVLEPEKRIPLELARRLARHYSGSVVDVETVREILHEKIDLEAVNDYLDNLRAVVTVPGPTPLAQEVFENPYVKRDVAVRLSRIALDKIVESIRKSIERREAILVCISCGHTWKARAGRLGKDPRCPKCGALTLAPLPATEYGSRMLDAYLRARKGEKLRGEERKLAREVVERARLYLHYSGQGLSKYVVEALMSYGVGPQRAKRLLATLLGRGERGFYEELLRAMEEYAANRQYWKARKKR